MEVISMRIQHNIMALNSNRQLGVNNSAVARSLEKLSSGYRINRAGDDAAGLAISEKMRAQIKGLEAATDNSQDAISLVQTAEGGLQEVHSMLNRMTELATKSANGTYTDDVDRKALQDEISALKDEINRIADGTDFNGIKLLDGSMGVGRVGATGIIAAGAGDGTMTGKAAEFTLEAPEGYTVVIGKGVDKGTASSATYDAANKKITISLENDKNKEYTQADLQNLINGVANVPAEAVGKIKISVTEPFKFATDTAAGADLLTLTSASPKQAFATGATSGITFTANKAGSGANGKTLTINAKSDATTVGATLGANGNVIMNLSETKNYTATEVNKILSDAGIDWSTNYEGTKTGKELANGASVAYTMGSGAGVSSGGGLTLQIGDTSESYNQLGLSIADMHVNALDLTSVDISTRDGAAAAMSKIKTAINTVSTSRGKLGAIQNRLEHTINNLGVTTENITSAESRIRDVDMAKEMMNYTKNSVLVQSAQAMLAQANQQPQSVLQLLQ